MDFATAIAVALIGGVAGVSGAFLGAHLAARESQANREEARRVRFAEVVRQLAAEILRAGQTHMDEVNLQVNSRVGTDPRSADNVPPVGSTEPMKLWVQELRLTAREPTTADAAHRFYATTAWLGGGLIYIAPRDRLPDGSVVLVTGEQFENFQVRLDRWVKDRYAFVNAVRTELGSEAFPDSDHG